MNEMLELDKECRFAYGNPDDDFNMLMWNGAE